MLHRLLAPFREFGVTAGSLYLVDRMLQRISGRTRLFCYELMVQPIPDKPLLPERLRQVEIREIRRGDPEVDLMPARPEIKQSRFDQGAVCLGAFQKGQFIGYMWFCSPTYEEDEVRCTYLLESAHNSVFDFDLYILPEYRLSLAFVGLWNGANAVLRQRGVVFTFSRLTRFNLASRRAHQHLGWKPVGRAVFLQLWRFQLMVATLFPYLHVSVSPRSRVRLRMRPTPLLRRDASLAT
jgi:hypothetical protein